MFSKNIVFFDGEFNGLNPEGTDFLSMAFIKPIDTESDDPTDWKDRQLYIELPSPKDIDHWVKKNVMPHMIGKITSIEKVKQQIWSFVGDSRPYLVADVNQFDWMGICKLFGVFNHPFHYIPVDFASILFAKGIDPDINRIEFAKSQGIDTSKFKQHNALDDCRVLRELWFKI